MRGVLRIRRHGRRAPHPRIARRYRRIGAHQRALDHRPPGLAPRVVRVGKRGARRVFHAGGRQIALGHVRAGIARHLS